MNYGAEPADQSDPAHQCHRHRMFTAEELAVDEYSKPETGKDDTTVEGNGDGNG